VRADAAPHCIGYNEFGGTIMAAEIHDRGRGPEIKGTRITVYDVMDYSEHGDDRAYIASILRLTPEEVDVAIRYIEQHKAELWPKYQRMLAWAEEGNPPHVLEKLQRSHEKMMARRRALEQRAAERNAAGHAGEADARAAG
jgi:uncharacterized protein (DUF433 family)